MTTKLSVNINKIATIRNARGGNNPDVLKVALDCELFGADGITVHPRPDERHIRFNDVIQLKKNILTEFNIEGYPDNRFINLIKETFPAQVTLVPDSPTAITSNAGWDIITHFSFLQDIIAELKSYGARVSLFVDPNVEMVMAAKNVGADRIELYTGPYAYDYILNPEKSIEKYIQPALKAKELGLGVNAGHDLDLINLNFLKQTIPFLNEVSIGHALISDALYLGLKETIKQYKEKLLI